MDVNCHKRWPELSAMASVVDNSFLIRCHTKLEREDNEKLKI